MATPLVLKLEDDIGAKLSGGLVTDGREQGAGTELAGALQFVHRSVRWDNACDAENV